MILDPLDDTERTYMKRVLRAPYAFLPFLIQRPWTKYASTLRAET